jgi:hypothetical protein
MNSGQAATSSTTSYTPQAPTPYRNPINANAPLGASAGGYFNSNGQYQTGWLGNPNIPHRQGINEGAAYKAPDTTVNPNQMTWDQWDKTMQNQYGTGQGAMGSLGTAIGGGGGASQGNSGNPYGAGYTGFGGSSLSASGNPNYGGGGESGMPTRNGPSSGPTGSNLVNGMVPNYYAGPPGGHLVVPGLGLPSTPSYPMPTAPSMSNLNTMLMPAIAPTIRVR